MSERKHCDDYIDDETQPECLRKFLDHVRSPAHGMMRDDPRPRLLAKYKGQLVRVTFASRMGDVGISNDLKQTHGYQRRVMLSDLTDFRP